MNNGWINILKLFMQKRLPVIATILMMLLFFVPIDSTKIDYFRPAVSVICVYFWAMRQANIFSYLSAFFIGFLLDIYSSTPLGMNAFLLMSLVAVLRIWHRHLQTSTFCGEWIVFSFLGLGFILIKWILLSLYYREILPFMIMMLNYLSTITFYPLIAYINIWLLNKFLLSERVNEL